MGRCGYALISGFLMTAAFPRLGLWGLAWCALMPLLLAIRDAGPGAAFRLGMLAGLAHYLTLVYWVVHTMGEYGGLPLYLTVPLLFLLAAYLALYPACFAALMAGGARFPLILPLAAAPAWAGLEYLRGLLLTGFPWALLGHSQYRALPIIQVADIGGAAAVSFLIVLVNSALLLGLLHLGKFTWQGRQVGRRTAVAGMLAAIVLTGGAALYGTWRIQTVTHAMETAPRAVIGLAQGNIDQKLKWDPAFQRATIATYLRLSRAILKDDPQLIVWPETAAPFYLFHQPEPTRMLLSGIDDMDTPFIIGCPAFDPEGAGADGRGGFYNRAYLIDPDGHPLDYYDKVHLVPFGEYVPLQRYLPFVKKLVAQVGDFRRGRKGDILETGGAIRPGMLICYEIIFPELARAAVRNGANLLVNITNDAWYGLSSAPYQHFSMAVFRAVENRRFLVRSANTGISGFIAPTGRIAVRTALFREAALARPGPLLDLDTLYTRVGDLFARSCLGAAAILLFIGKTIRRRPT